LFEAGKAKENHYNRFTNKGEFFKACIDEAAKNNHGEKPISTAGQMYQAVVLWKLFRDHQGLLLVAATETEWLDTATFIRNKLAEDKVLAEMLKGKGIINSTISGYSKSKKGMFALEKQTFSPANADESAFIMANMGEAIPDIEPVEADEAAEMEI